MRETQLSLRELGLIAGTRALVCAGIGLLLGNRLSPRERKVFGWTLFLAGAASTIPLAADILARSRESATLNWWKESEMSPASRRMNPTSVVLG